MNRALVCGLFAGLMVAAGAAQQGGFQAGQRGPGGGWSGGGWFDRLLERIATELKLDDAQRSALETIAEPHRQRVQEMGQKLEQWRAASSDEDHERAEVLRAELAAARSPSVVMSRLLEEIEPILRDDQLARYDQLVDEVETRRRDVELLRRVFSELPSELRLDETQQAEWDRLLAARRRARAEQASALQPLREALREAEEAGDEERARELRRQLLESRPDRPESFAAFFDELEKILRPEQLAVLDRYRRELGVAGTPDPEYIPDVRTILRAAKRVRLSGTQRHALREIEREAAKARKSLDRHDAAAADKLARTVRQRIVALLDDRQVGVFEQCLHRLDRRYQPAGADQPPGKGP